jgi:probable HAF family extracellular repeat protein
VFTRTTTTVPRPAVAYAPGPRIIDLGTLPGDRTSQALAVNDRGGVAGVSAGAPGTPTRAFVRRRGRMAELPGLGGDTCANDVNNHGVVVGATSRPGEPARAALWHAGGLVDLGTPGGAYSIATAVNDAGVVVGYGEGRDGALHAFSWRDGVRTDLGAGHGWSTADGVDAAGRVVGLVSADGTKARAVAWTRGRARVLADVDGCVSGTSKRGEVVGHTAAGRSWLWSRGRLTAVPVPPGETFLRLQAVNDGGEAVGRGDRHAWLWRAGQFTALPGPAGTTEAFDVNDAGVVVGSSAGRAALWMR